MYHHHHHQGKNIHPSSRGSIILCDSSFSIFEFFSFFKISSSGATASSFDEILAPLSPSLPAVPSDPSNPPNSLVSQLCNVGDNTAHYNGITHAGLGLPDTDAWYTIETIAEKNNIGYKQIIKIRGFLSHIQQLYSCYWGIYSIKVHSVSPYGLPSPHPQDANNDNQQPAEASGVGRSWVQSMFTRDTSLRSNSFSRVRKWTSDSGNLVQLQMRMGLLTNKIQLLDKRKYKPMSAYLEVILVLSLLYIVSQEERCEIWWVTVKMQVSLSVESTDCSVKIWDPSLRGSELRATLKGHTGTVRAVSLDRGKVVSGSDDQSVIVWDKQTTQLLEELKGHDAQLAANQGFAPPAPSEVACH